MDAVESKIEVAGGTSDLARATELAAGMVPDASGASPDARRACPVALGTWFPVLLTVAGYWLVVVYQLGAQWSAYPQYSYGWAVPVLCLGLLWRRWAEATTTGQRDYRTTGPQVRSEARRVGEKRR